MRKNKLLLLLALLLTAATGAWAEEQSETFTTTATIVEGTHFTIDNHDEWADSDGMTAKSGITVTPKNGETITKVVISCTWDPGQVNNGNTSVSSGTKEITNGGGTITVTGVNASTFTFTCSNNGPQFGQFVVYYAAPAGYTVSMKDGVKDADKWKVKVGEGQAQALPIGGLKGDGSETVTLKYTGRLKVKGVKATSDAAPAEAPATPLDNTITAWTAGTFAVPAGGLTYSDAITVSGDVTLVLTDGQTLTLNKGISLASGATLTIQGNGTMNVNGTNESTASTVAGTGTLVLTSGTLTAKGGNGGSVGEYEDEVTKSAGGIAINGAVTVSGGTLTATGGNGGAGGSGQDSRAGAGAAAISGDVTVSGGTLTATGGNGGSFSGDTLGPDGYAGAGGTAIVGSVTITDGTVTATGGNGGSFTISNYGYALYAGNGGAAIGGNATLTGGTLNQTNGTNGTLGGSGTKEECSAGTGGKAVAGTVTDNRN